MNQADKNQAQWSQAKARYIESKGKGEAQFSDSDWEEINKLYNQMAGVGVGMQKSDLSKGQNGDHKAEGYTLSHDSFKDKHETEHHITAHDKSGKAVGLFVFNQINHSPESLYIKDSEAHPDHQRKGLASAAYALAESKSGAKISPEPHAQTPAAKKLWNSPNKNFGKSFNQQSGLSKTQSMGHRIGISNNNVGGLFKEDILPKDTAKPGVSPQGIEVRRADKKADKDIPHGYQRTNTPEAHMEAAKGMARAAIARLKETKPNLTKAELIEAEDLLYKGAMARLAPFNPKGSLNDEQKKTMADWQGSPSDGRAVHREVLPAMEGPARERALHKLSGSTSVRKTPSGKREFLLHRGMGQEEAGRSIKGSIINHPDAHSSWTPKENTANNFANPYIKTPGQRVSAWIHEDNIHTVPKQFGSVDAEYEASSGSKQNRMHIEHEVVVKPNHSSSIHESKVAERPTTYTKDRIHDAPKDLNDKINMAGAQDVKDRKLFGKAEHALDLIKGAMQRIAPFNPMDVPNKERKPVEKWTSGFGSESRKDIPAMSGSLRERSLHRLSAQTATRTNDQGDREFLLHRGMGHDEHNRTIKDNTATHGEMSSWTPHKKVASAFAGDYSNEHDHGKVVSAWVNEKHIQNVPHMIGSMMDYEGNARPDMANPEKSRMAGEFEVVVKPKHNSPIVNTMSAEPKSGGEFGNQYHVPAAYAAPADLHGKINDKAYRASKEYNPYNLAKAEIKKCSCGKKLTTDNAKYIGTQELPEGFEPGMKMNLYNCPKCDSTVTHLTPK